MNMERIKPTRSGLFAIELLISVGVFSLCAAICVGLFVRSEIISRDCADLNRAVNEARSVANCFKAAGGDIGKTAELTGGEVISGDAVCIGYDNNWNKLAAGTACSFSLSLTVKPQDGYSGASLSVERYERQGAEATGETILFWEIAALEVAS